MIDSWLECKPREDVTSWDFSIIDVFEICSPDENMLKYLADKLLNERIGCEFIEKAKSLLGERWRKIIEKGLPAGQKLKRGDFGELIATLGCEKWDGFIVPVRKLRFAMGGSSIGTDILAIRIDKTGNVGAVRYIESKLRTRNDPSAGQQAYKQLEKVIEEDYATIHEFVAQVLISTNSDLSTPFMRFLASRNTTEGIESFRVFLTWEKSQWSESVLENLSEYEIQAKPLDTHVAHINELAKLVDDIYARVGLEVTEDED